MKTAIKLFILTILTTFTFQVFAQQTSVPLCDKLEVVDAELEKKLQLFTEYEGFQQALLYKESDDLFVLEIIYKPKDVFQVERKPMTKSALETFCERINQSDKIQEILSINQDGRQEYLISSTVSGLGLYAWALPRALNIEEERPFIATYMLVGGGSFYAPFLLTKNKEITKPMARSYSIGTVTGTGHGFIVYNLMQLNDVYDPFNGYDYEKQNRRLFVPMAFSLGESFGMMALTKKYDLSLSNLGMITTGSVWGAGYGASFGNFLTKESDINNDFYDQNTRRISYSTLIGSGLGMYAGHYIHSKIPDMTVGDMIVSNAYGILGALYAATITDLALDFNDYNDSKVLLGSMTAASAAGIAYGLHRGKGYNYTSAEGAYIGLSEIAGGLVGIGVGYLITDELESETALVSASLGASAGIFLIDRYLRTRSLKTSTSIGNINFGFNPMGVANAFDTSEKPNTIEYLQRSTDNYIVRIGMTF
ncbi:MAG: hypothetical protein AB8G11_23970 [Saprospiraceae bacterium]